MYGLKKHTDKAFIQTKLSTFSYKSFRYGVVAVGLKYSQVMEIFVFTYTTCYTESLSQVTDELKCNSRHTPKT